MEMRIAIIYICTWWSRSGIFCNNITFHINNNKDNVQECFESFPLCNNRYLYIYIIRIAYLNIASVRYWYNIIYLLVRWIFRNVSWSRCVEYGPRIRWKHFKTTHVRIYIYYNKCSTCGTVEIIINNIWRLITRIGSDIYML